MVYFSANIIAQSAFRGNLVFTNVQLNTGNSYNSETGTFSVPHNGVYVFFVSVLTMSFSAHCEIQLRVNNESTSRFPSLHQNVEVKTNYLVTVLEEGDEVSAYNHNCHLGFPEESRDGHSNIFTGFLLRSVDTPVYFGNEISVTKREARFTCKAREQV